MKLRPVIVCAAAGLAVAGYLLVGESAPPPDKAPDCPWTSTWFEWDFRHRLRDGMTLEQVEAVLGEGERRPMGITEHRGRYKHDDWNEIVVEGDTEFYRWERKTPSPWWRMTGSKVMTVWVGFVDGKAAHSWFDFRNND